MFWAFILLAIIYAVHIISLKGRFRGEIANAVRKGKINDIRSQLDYIANSMQSGQKMYYIGTLSELYVYLNEKIQKESSDWVLIVKS